MTIYQILGIEAGASKKEIKRAYAQKVKQLDLSKDMEAYQVLRKAYDVALSIQGSPEIRPEFQSVPDEAVTQEEISLTDDVMQIVELKKSLNQLLRETMTQEAYFDDQALWEDLLRPFLNESLQQYEETRERMIYFLVENHYLLSDEVKKSITTLCELTEEDWQAYYGYWDYRYVLAENHLRFADYQNIPKGQRETYYHYRYQIYHFLSDDQPENASIRSIVEKAKDFSYLDDDLLYLLALYYLGQSKEKISESSSLILNLLSRIEGTQYRQDCEKFARFTQYLNGEKVTKLTYAEIKELEWTSERLKRYWVSLLYPNKATKEVKAASTKSSPSWQFIWVAIAILGLIVRVGGMTSTQSNQQIKPVDQEIMRKIQSESLIDNARKFRSLKVHGGLRFFDDLFEKEGTAGTDSQWKEDFSDEGYAAYLAFKQNNQEQIKQIKLSSYLDREIFHSFADQGSIVQVRFQQLPDFTLAVFLNWQEQITNLAFQPDDLTLSSPGSYTAYDYFRRDLNQYGLPSETYLKVLSDLGADYFSEELRTEMILVAEDEDKLIELRGFVNQPGYLFRSEQLVLALKKEEDILFIEFNEREKLAQIYGGSFAEAPQAYMDQVAGASFDFPS